MEQKQIARWLNVEPVIASSSHIIIMIMIISKSIAVDSQYFLLNRLPRLSHYIPNVCNMYPRVLLKVLLASTKVKHNKIYTKEEKLF